VPVLELRKPAVAIRIVAKPEEIDSLTISTLEATPVERGALLRLAPDEALVVDANPQWTVVDEHDIVADDTSIVGAWISEEYLVRRIAPLLEWKLPTKYPATAQGLLLGVPVKILLERDRSHNYLCCAVQHAHELQERLP
jgi:hypothetical protein